MSRYRLSFSVLIDRSARTFRSHEVVAEFAHDQAAQEEAQALRDRLLAEQGQAWVWLTRLDPPDEDSS